MSQAIPLNEKIKAININTNINNTTKFIRTGSTSPPSNQPQSQSFIPASHSLQKRPQQIKKGIISRKTGERQPQTVIPQEKPNNRNPQNPVGSKSKSKIESVQHIAMAMSASIFMNSTTKFVKGLLLGQQAKTQRGVSDDKQQNQNYKKSPPARANVKNPQQTTQRSKSQKKINQTAKISQVQNIQIEGQVNRRYSPSKNNQNVSSALRSANIPQNQQKKKEQSVQPHKKSIDRKQAVKRQSTPPNQKSSNKNVSPNQNKMAKSPQNNAFKMAGQQFLSSTTKFNKDVGLPASTEVVAKIDSRKGKSSPPAIQRLQTQLSFTPIKSTIGIYSNPELSTPIKSPTRNRLQTETINKVIPENAEQNTRKIQRRGTKTRDIKFVQKKQQEPVSILNYNNNKVQNEKIPTSQKNAQPIQTKKQVEVVPPKKIAGIVEKKETAKQMTSDSFKNVSKPGNRFIANFSNNQSRVQEKNQAELATTKKGPFVRQIANKETNNKKQQALDRTKTKNDLRNSKNLEKTRQEVLRKEQKSSLSNNIYNIQHPKSPKISQNSITTVANPKENQIKRNLKKDEISPQMSKIEEQISDENRKYGLKKPNQQRTVINSAKPKQNKPDSNQPKLNQSKSAEVLQNLWSRPTQPRKIVTQTKIQTNDAPQENKGLQKHTQNIKSSPSLYSNKNIKQQKNEIIVSKTQKIIFSQTENKISYNTNRIGTSPANNQSEAVTTAQKQRIQSKGQKEITNEKQKQLNILKLKRSDLVFHSLLKLYASHLKIYFDQLRSKSASEARHKKQANILAHNSSSIYDKLKINHLAHAFLTMKKSLLIITPSTKTNEMLKESAKNQAVTLIVRNLVQKQKHIYKILAQYSWVKKQTEVISQSFDKKLDPKINQIINKKQISNLLNILRNFNLNKLRIAYNKIVNNAFGTPQTKKNIQIINNNTHKKNINYSKSPQKPIRNYAEEKRVLIESKSEIQSQIQRIDYRISDKKRSVQFERGKLIKKMDQLTKKVKKLQPQVLQKRKRNQQIQISLANLASSGIQLQIEEGEPKIELLTQIYSELFRNNQENINIEQFERRFKLDKQNCIGLVQQWNTLRINTELKKEIGLWEGYEAKEQKLRVSLKIQQQLQCQLLQGYIRERYLWQWVHLVSQKI